MENETFNFRCSSDFMKMLKDYAKSKDLSITTIIKLAVQYYIENHK